MNLYTFPEEYLYNSVFLSELNEDLSLTNQTLDLNDAVNLWVDGTLDMEENTL
jgi:hypothetical protein